MRAPGQSTGLLQITLGGPRGSSAHVIVPRRSCAHCASTTLDQRSPTLCTYCLLSLPMSEVQRYEQGANRPAAHPPPGPMHHFAPGGVVPTGPISPSGMAYFSGGGGTIGAGTRGFGSSMPARGGFRDPTDDGPKGPLEDVDADRAPDLMEHVLAWRGWNTTPDGHLVAAAQDGIWDPGENKAICNRSNHTDIPAEKCTCGFYGWHFPSDIAHGEIWGALKCRGEIIVHDVGIRAEYAEIVVILDRAGPGERNAEHLARIVDRYKVPIVDSIEEAERIAGEHGVRLPESMRPKRPEDPAFADISLAMSKMLASGMPPREVIRTLELHTGRRTGELVEAMKQIGKSMEGIGEAAGKALAAFGSAAGPLQMLQSSSSSGAPGSANQSAAAAHLAAGAPGYIGIGKVPPPKLKPTGIAQAVSMLVPFFVLMGGWIAFSITSSPPPPFGILVGGAIGFLCFVSPFPDALWRFAKCIPDSTPVEFGLFCFELFGAMLDDLWHLVRGR